MTKETQRFPYLPPQLTVVTFAAERGYAFSLTGESGKSSTNPHGLNRGDNITFWGGSGADSDGWL